jgi:hypothetical protein
VLPTCYKQDGRKETYILNVGGAMQDTLLHLLCYAPYTEPAPTLHWATTHWNEPCLAQLSPMRHSKSLTEPRRTLFSSQLIVTREFFGLFCTHVKRAFPVRDFF